jgi:CRP-like cAMP-binding protein
MTDITSVPLDTKEALKEIMAQHIFLKDFGPKHLDLFDECASVAEFNAQSYLFREREEADRLYLIHRGSVAIEIQPPSSNPYVVMTVCDGGIVGWGWAFPPYRRPFSCRALIDTVAIGLESACLLAKCREDYEVGYKLMSYCALILGERLWASRLQMMSLLLKEGR